MQPKELTLRLLARYTPALEKARMLGYNEHLKLSSYKEDKYDDSSWHLVAMIGDEIIGTVRITPFPLSPIHDWTGGEAELPLDKSVVTISKGFMLPEHRQNGIFKLIFSSALLWAENKGYRYAIGAYVPNVKSKEFTIRLGFEEVSQQITVEIPPYPKTTIIPIINELKSKIGSYRKEFEIAKALIELNNPIRIDFPLPNYSEQNLETVIYE